MTGEREHGSETYKLWTELYPNDWLPYNAIANNAVLLGRYETAVDYARKAMELGPSQDFGASNLIAALIGLNRLNDAKSVCEQLLAKGRDNSFIHLNIFSQSRLSKAIKRQLIISSNGQGNIPMTWA